MNISSIQIKSVQALLLKRQQVNSQVNGLGLPDIAIYFYYKEATFLKNKQQRAIFYFFQGLNTNPQNLSIFLRNELQKDNKSSKQKLVKGVFIVYDIFTKSDCVIEINIPGNLKIFKIVNNKKELITNNEIDMMFISSVLRSIWRKNILWGKNFYLFQQDPLNELKLFLEIFFRVITEKEISLGEEFEMRSEIKGCHGCSLLLEYVKENKIGYQVLQITQKLMKQHPQYAENPKIQLFCAQIWAIDNKHHKSLEKIGKLLKIFPNDPYILFYQAKYLFKLSLFIESLAICKAIVQYNQFQVWILLAEIHLQLKNFCDVLVCLNLASKLAKYKVPKNPEQFYKIFEDLGKVNYLSTLQPIQKYPKMHFQCQSPSTIPVNLVQEKFKPIIQKPYWKLNSGQKKVYAILQDLRYSLEARKFQQLLQNTFEQSTKKKQITVYFRNGISDSMFIEDVEDLKKQPILSKNKLSQTEDIPTFLQDQSMDMDEGEEIKHHTRNLSIIPEIQSVIENSQYEERQKQKHNSKIKLKRQINQTFYKLISMVLTQSDFQKSQFEANYAKILPVYNKLRVASPKNNYFICRMFKIFLQTANYKSVLVMVAETLDHMQRKGLQKINKLPIWMHRYIFTIIEEKGLKFLNQLIQKMNYYDEAVFDAIQMAKKWKMKGITY